MSIQPVNNAAMTMQGMSAAGLRQNPSARTPQESAVTGVEGTGTRSDKAQQGVSAPENGKRVPTTKEVQQALDEVEKAVAPMAQSLQFSLDKDSGKTVVKVMDTETNEVIRQIPSEEVLAISKAVDKLKGLLLKQQA